MHGAERPPSSGRRHQWRRPHPCRAAAVWGTPPPLADARGWTGSGRGPPSPRPAWWWVPGWRRPHSRGGGTNDARGVHTGGMWGTTRCGKRVMRRLVCTGVPLLYCCCFFPCLCRVFRVSVINMFALHFTSPCTFGPAPAPPSVADVAPPNAATPSSRCSAVPTPPSPRPRSAFLPCCPPDCTRLLVLVYETVRTVALGNLFEHSAREGYDSKFQVQT